jgi:hypothetical protein
MNRFLKNILLKLIILLFFISLIVGGAFYFNYNHKIDYPAAIINKYQRLDSFKKTAKIIICGGSSSSYSIDSELLEKTLKKPVVNTSLAMSLGSKFHLNITKDYLHKGDVILYIPEYEYYYGKENGDDFLYTTAFYYPKVVKDFTTKQKDAFFEKAFRLSIEYYIGALNKKNNKGNKSLQYKRESYDYLGDNISLRSSINSKIEVTLKNRYQKLKSKKVSKEFIIFLKKINAEYVKKGITLLITYPPLEKSQFDNRFLKDIDKVKRETGITFFGNPNDYLYSADLFYDSSYHLNGKGRILRTKKLIKTLKEQLN